MSGVLTTHGKPSQALGTRGRVEIRKPARAFKKETRAMIEVLAKGLGKNVDEATVKTWFVEEGDTVTGARIVKIGEDSVIVRIDDNKDIKLNLKR